MNTQVSPAAASAEKSGEARPNGGGAAALLAAGIGSFALAALAIAADRIGAVKSAMTLSKPTGPLSGVTTVAVLIWLAAWVFLEWRWGKRTVEMRGVAAFALALLFLALLLTFPPLADLF